jgi:single-strand DNA-binding protein
MNQVILVGRLTSDPDLVCLDNGMKVSTVSVAVKRPFKSGDSNQYETDFFRCTLWSGIAEATVNYCKKGYTVGIKGRLQQKHFVQDGKNLLSYPEIVVEKINFISKTSSESE